MQEVNEILPNTYAAIYKFVKENGQEQKFAAEIQFSGNNQDLTVNLYGETMNEIATDYLTFFDWIFRK